MKRLIISLLALATIATAGAQIRLGGGNLTGSLESNSIYYLNDSHPQIGEREKAFGSNDYIKLAYYNGRWSAGLQGDAYLPVLTGYDDIENVGGTDPMFVLSQMFVNYRGDWFEATAGDFFEQFGSGLVYRSFEDRQLGFNTATQGLRFTATPTEWLGVKAFVGRPRMAVVQHAGSLVSGLDASVNLGSLLQLNNMMLMAEGSYVNRYESLDKEGSEMLGFEFMGLESPMTHLYSARTMFDWNGLTVKGEYVGKSLDISENGDMASNGKAILGEIGYTYGKFNIMAQTRLIENIGTRLSVYDAITESSMGFPIPVMGNTLNYIPALTRQHTYLLANLEPHQVNTHSELAAQVDAYYSIRHKTDRRNYWRFHINASMARNQEYDNLTWLDVNVDVERQWNKNWKATFMYSMQKRSPSKGFIEGLYTSNIFVADVTHKLSTKNSLRAELQYLYSNDYEGDWMAALVEFNMAPSWSLFVSDMYNNQRVETEYNQYLDKLHYYSVGASYTYDRTRVQLSYGRNRAGMVCSGGVCRYTPAYTGFNLLLSTSF